MKASRKMNEIKTMFSIARAARSRHYIGGGRPGQGVREAMDNISSFYFWLGMIVGLRWMMGEEFDAAMLEEQAEFGDKWSEELEQ